MQTEYTTVVDPAELVPLAIAMGVHVVAAVLQAGLALFLIASGAYALAGAAVDSVWARRLGLTIGGVAVSRVSAGLRIGLGVLLVLPFLAGAPTIVSLLAGVLAFGALLLAERAVPTDVAPQGRMARRVAVFAAAAVALFIVWEGEDGLALAVALTTNMSEWRVHELEWQHEKDVNAPKVGDLAPDFELQDPEGRAAVRLSDFRDKRPVVLVFGSYT